MPVSRRGDRRIWRHPILVFNRGKRVRFYFEDKVVEAFEGESVAAALYAIGVDVFSWSPKLGRPRGAFCMIGKCSSCFMEVDGKPNVRTCIEPVREGIKVRRQKGLPEIPSEGAFSKGEVEEVEVDLLVVGGGPAGLMAALTGAKCGLTVLLVDEHFKLGGQLVKQTHKFFGSREFFGGLRGFQIGEMLTKRIFSEENIAVLTRTVAYGIFRGGYVGLAGVDKLYNVKPKCVIVATGATEHYLAFPGNDLPGIMGAGGAQTLMNEYGVLPGEEVLVVGSGNVGLIVSYQLLQAGAKVKAVLEIMPEIGGWFVHAAKLRRYGVPILVSHTIESAWGSERVEGATIIEVDEKYQPIPESRQDVECDLILIAVGLAPDTRLLAQCGAVMRWVPELGGLTAVRTLGLETSIPGLFVAGDSSGVEEATAAMIEGEIAALSAALKIVGPSHELETRREELLKFLWDEYRMSPLLARARKGKESVTVSEDEMRELRRSNPPPVAFSG